MTWIFLSACSTPPPVPDDSYFRLAPSRLQQQFASPILSGELRVEVPEAAGVRRSRKMIYSEDAGHLRFQQYHYHHWEDSPPRLIQIYLTRMLQVSGVATAATEQRIGSSNYLLKSRVERFDRLLSDGGASAHIEIEFWLIDQQQQPGRIVLNRRYEEQVTASSMSIEATVLAFSTGLESISKRLLDDLGQMQL